MVFIEICFHKMYNYAVGIPKNKNFFSDYQQQNFKVDFNDWKQC